MDVMTDFEVKQLEGYTRIMEAAGGEGTEDGSWMFSFSQSFETHATHNGGKYKLQCLTTNSFPTWAHKRARWMTPSEALASSTLVVHPELSIFGGRTSFCSARSDHGLPHGLAHSCSSKQAILWLCLV